MEELMHEGGDDSMRNMLLAELIDNMHSRLADKMFPSEIKTEDVQDEKGMPPTTVEDVTAVEPSDESGEPTDEELEEMMKGA
jgi:hypothetical protein